MFDHLVELVVKNRDSDASGGNSSAAELLENARVLDCQAREIVKEHARLRRRLGLQRHDIRALGAKFDTAFEIWKETTDEQLRKRRLQSTEVKELLARTERLEKKAQAQASTLKSIDPADLFVGAEKILEDLEATAPEDGREPTDDRQPRDTELEAVRKMFTKGHTYVDTEHGAGEGNEPQLIKSQLWKLVGKGDREKYFCSVGKVSNHLAAVRVVLRENRDRQKKFTGSDLVDYLLGNLVKNTAIAAGFFLFLGALYQRVESWVHDTSHGTYLTFQDVLINGVKLSVIVVLVCLLGIPLLRLLCRYTRFRPDHALVVGIVGAVALTVAIPVFEDQFEPEYLIFAGEKPFRGRIVEKFGDGIVIKAPGPGAISRFGEWIGRLVPPTWANASPTQINPDGTREGSPANEARPNEVTNAMYVPLSAIKCIARGDDFEGYCDVISRSKGDIASGIESLSATISNNLSIQKPHDNMVPVVIDRTGGNDGPGDMRFTVYFDEDAACEEPRPVERLRSIAAALRNCPLPAQRRFALQISAFHSSSGSLEENQAVALDRLNCTVEHFVRHLGSSHIGSMTTNYSVSANWSADLNLHRGQYQDELANRPGSPEYERDVGFLNRRVDIEVTPGCELDGEATVAAR